MRSDDETAKAFGISRDTMRRELYIDANKEWLDPADFAEWDEGKLSTNKAFQRIKAAMTQAEKERDEAREEVAALERQNDELYAQKNPEPEVIEREVVREVVPEDVQKRIESLEYYKELGEKDNATLRRQLEETRKKLDRAKVLLEEKGYEDNASWDISALTSATNQYLRTYGGKAWAFDQFYRVDEVTQQEFVKAITTLAAFAQNLAQMVSDTNKLEA